MLSSNDGELVEVIVVATESITPREEFVRDEDQEVLCVDLTPEPSSSTKIQFRKMAEAKSTTAQASDANNSAVRETSTGEETAPVETWKETVDKEPSTGGEETPVKQTSTGEETVAKETSTDEETAVKETSTDEETAVKKTSTEGETAVKKLSTGEETAVKESSTGEEAAGVEPSAGEEAAGVESSTGGEAAAKVSSKEETSVEPTSADEDTAVKELSTGEETAVKDSFTGDETASTGEQTAMKETYTGEAKTVTESPTGEETAVKETSTGEEAAGVEPSAGEEAAGVESSTGEETGGKESSTGEEKTAVKESSTGEETAMKEISTGEETAMKEISTGEETAMKEISNVSECGVEQARGSAFAEESNIGVSSTEGTRSSVYQSVISVEHGEGTIKDGSEEMKVNSPRPAAAAAAAAASKGSTVTSPLKSASSIWPFKKRGVTTHHQEKAGVTTKAGLSPAKGRATGSATFWNPTRWIDTILSGVSTSPTGDGRKKDVAKKTEKGEWPKYEVTKATTTTNFGSLITTSSESESTSMANDPSPFVRKQSIWGERLEDASLSSPINEDGRSSGVSSCLRNSSEEDGSLVIEGGASASNPPKLSDAGDGVFMMESNSGSAVEGGRNNTAILEPMPKLEDLIAEIENRKAETTSAGGPKSTAPSTSTAAAAAAAGTTTSVENVVNEKKTTGVKFGSNAIVWPESFRHNKKRSVSNRTTAAVVFSKEDSSSEMEHENKSVIVGRFRSHSSSSNAPTVSSHELLGESDWRLSGSGSKNRSGRFAYSRSLSFAPTDVENKELMLISDHLRVDDGSVFRMIDTMLGMTILLIIPEGDEDDGALTTTEIEKLRREKKLRIIKFRLPTGMIEHEEDPEVSQMVQDLLKITDKSFDCVAVLDDALRTIRRQTTRKSLPDVSPVNNTDSSPEPTTGCPTSDDDHDNAVKPPPAINQDGFDVFIKPQTRLRELASLLALETGATDMNDSPFWVL